MLVSCDVVFEKYFPFIDHKDKNQEQFLPRTNGWLNDAIFIDDFDGWESHDPHDQSTSQPNFRHHLIVSVPSMAHQPWAI